MSIDFNIETNRKNQHSAKWSEMGASFSKDDLLPMWVADMDIQCAPEIIDYFQFIRSKWLKPRKCSSPKEPKECD